MPRTQNYGQALARGDLRPIHIAVRKALSRIEPPDFLFCPVKRRSYVSNAAQHISAKEVRTLRLTFTPISLQRRAIAFIGSFTRSCGAAQM
jgi:hypothetical protein